MEPNRYNPSEIEKKWQQQWATQKTYRTEDPSESSKPKFYILDMFPYPSGEGLHVGHPKGYIATDVISRMKRMQGFNVLHPMGFDAFGLPAENYAIKMKVNPAVAVAKNVEHYKNQLEIIGFDYDWSREINTTDPKYYKWTQWIFLKLLEKGLAFESHEPINWCPVDKTGLANEDVEDGKCERCGAVVEKKLMRQWVLKITDYTDRLLADLDATDYEMPRLIDKVNPHQPGKPLVERQVAHAIVYDPKTNKYLIIRNKKFNWDTVIIGGIEEGEDAISTAKREVQEETGYTNIEFKRVLGGQTEAQYYTKHKGENRIAYATAVYFELKSDARVPLADGEDADNEILWISPEDFVAGKMVNSEIDIWLERIADPKKGWPKPLLDWPESIKEAQRNWIGRSEGAEIDFKIVGKDESIKVFTTRPDTLFGVTYVVLAPEHKLVQDLLSSVSNKDEVEAYIQATKTKTEIDRTDATKEKTGVELKGIIAINPANGEEIPVWIADYALADYGTGAVMAVPAHDERDFEFGKKFNLPILKIISSEAECYTGEGPLINSGEFNGQNSEEAKKKITEFVKGKWVVKYKLRDWVFSRQRYWGEPMPILHDEQGNVVPLSEKELPLVLPEVEFYEPTDNGESPLANIPEWVNVEKDGKKFRRETNTMPQWAGSSWYYLRYMDPGNENNLVDPSKEKYWNEVDLYVGGAEHATRHLIYARFWHKFLYDIGAVSTIEPFRKLQHVGLITAEDGRKMSKRWGNVVNPDEIVKNFGADALRVYEMFMGPFDQAIAWNTNGLVGTRRFLEKVWKLRGRVTPNTKSSITNIIQKTIRKISEDIASMRFNTAVSQLMITSNEMEKLDSITTEDYETFLKLLAPFAPHITEELWNSLGHSTSVHKEPWPAFDPSKITDESVKIAVQINGKTREIIDLPKDSTEEEVQTHILNLPSIKKWIEGKTVKKAIWVKNKIINLLVDL